MGKQLAAVALFVTLVVLAVLWPHWSSLDSMATRRADTLSQPRKELLVGVSWPFAINQDGLADGLKLAQEEINQQGLPHGMQLKLDLRDDQADWDSARKIALDFAGNANMSAVLGYYDDSIAIRASNIYERSHLLHMVLGSDSSALTDHGNQYIVHTILQSGVVARAMANALPPPDKPRNFAVIWEKDADGESLAYQYRIAQDALNGDMVYQLTYSPEHADFQLAINELKEINPNIILFMGHESHAAAFLRLAHEADLDAPILGVYRDTPDLRKLASSAMEGTMLLDFYDVDANTPKNQSFVQKFRARYGRAPDTWAAQGYDALHLLAQAVYKTRSRDARDLVLALRYMPTWQGVNGQYKFNHRGELQEKPVYIRQFKNGMPVTIKTVLASTVTKTTTAATAEASAR